MKTQIIQDYKGLPIGVFIPIEDWENLKKHYPNLENINDELPQWQKDILDARLDDYYKNPTDVMDFDKMIDAIEKRLL